MFTLCFSRITATALILPGLSLVNPILNCVKRLSGVATSATNTPLGEYSGVSLGLEGSLLSSAAVITRANKLKELALVRLS